MFNGFAHTGTGYIPEMEQTISQLERGTLVTKFSWRKKAEQKMLRIRRETRQIIWTKPKAGPKSPPDGAVELREIKEIRLGKTSKDFEKWPDDTVRIDAMKCFVILYGSEFQLRVLSIAGEWKKWEVFASGVTCSWAMVKLR